MAEVGDAHICLNIMIAVCRVISQEENGTAYEFCVLLAKANF